MRLLVLGGTRFVGRALVAEALGRGWTVTALHRGVTGSLPAGVEALLADRTNESALAGALSGRTWDAVVDTWSGAPVVAGLSARLLRDRAERLGYVSSSSVYVWGGHVDEASPVVDVDADADSTDGGYAELKRGSELAVLRAFPDAVLARAGLILGPWEDIGRLPWWLDRISHGGPFVAPGRPDRPLQYIDVRDLAGWLLSALVDGVTGAVDAVGPSGHATTAELLAACVQATGAPAEPVWIDEQTLAECGAEPWTHLPCWVPERGEYAGFLEAGASLAASTGLHCRPVAETVLATWRWMQQEPRPPQRTDRAVHGLPADIESRLLASPSGP